MPRKKKFSHPRMLSPVGDRSSIYPNIGDETFCNGVFKFNVSAILKWIDGQDLPIVDVPIHLWGADGRKKEDYVAAADLQRPILIVEMAPDYLDFVPNTAADNWLIRGYVCIDGYHRIEKAHRAGIDHLPAFILRMEQHFPFMYKGQEQYVEYWNGKLLDRMSDAEIWQRHSALEKKYTTR